jgi:hypothetical protein
MARPDTTRANPAQPESATRRDLVGAGGLAGAALATGAARMPGYPPPSPLDTGGVQGGDVTFAIWRATTKPPSGRAAQERRPVALRPPPAPTRGQDPGQG